ncbi:MAG: metallophosphoesterase [Clostridia bacterium]|nr:metallophosphoesterase [Clostridia bacterium]
MKLSKSGKILIVLAVCVAVVVAAMLGLTASTKNADYTAPSVESPLGVPLADGEKTVLAFIADPQVSFYSSERYSVFQAACEDLHNASGDFDALIGLGDITENATMLDYKLVKDKLAGLDARYIMASGNHDIRLRIYAQSLSAFSGMTNELNGDEAVDSYHYSERIGGYKVIVLGSDKTKLEQAYISPEQLQWLDSELEAEDGNPTFVLLHQPLKDTHNEMQAFGSITKIGGSVGEQSQDIQDILSKYDNVFLVSGHLHSGFGPDSYNEVDGIHSINVPSFSIVNKDGIYNDAGTGYIAEIYEDQIIFRARDFAKGAWVADITGDSSYDIVIGLEK